MTKLLQYILCTTPLPNSQTQTSIHWGGNAGAWWRYVIETLSRTNIYIVRYCRSGTHSFFMNLCASSTTQLRIERALNARAYRRRILQPKKTLYKFTTYYYYVPIPYVLFALLLSLTHYPSSDPGSRRVRNRADPVLDPV